MNEYTSTNFNDASLLDYKVADIELAEFGRKEITLA